MESSSNDVKETTDLDNSSQIRQTTTPPTTSNPSRSSSPSCQTLLVIDDNSNSEELSATNTNSIPVKPTRLATAPMALLQAPTNTLSPSTHDITNNTVEQQRRRNSSIAKLLGGHPLNNQQYEEIHQQILNDQSTQNATNNNDNGIDLGLQRSRSSITRTLLMNAERTNSVSKLSTNNTQSASLSTFSKDFEYLIRRELDKPDTDHPSVALQRHNSAPKIFQNLGSSGSSNASSPIQSKLKRKRPLLKAPLTTPNKPSANVPPFALNDPFELDSSETSSIPILHHSHPQIDYLHFDPSKRPRHSNSQQYQRPVNTSSTNPSPYPYHKINMNSSLYNQFNIHQDHAQSTNGSPFGNHSHYMHSTKVTPPSTTHPLPSAATIPHNDNTPKMTLTSKAKPTAVRSETQEAPRQRSYSNLSNHSDSSPSASSETNGPLKKRLLQAYNSEQHPASSL